MYEALTSQIIAAIADRKGVEPDDLGIVLAEHVNVEAVEQLAKHDSSTWRVKFELPKHLVTVKSNGDILVDDQLQKNWRSA